MESAAGLLGFFMLLQLVFMLALLAGGLYALFALGRAAAGLDRLAAAVESWVAQQQSSVSSAPPQTPSTLAAPSTSVPPVAENRPSETYESTV